MCGKIVPKEHYSRVYAANICINCSVKEKQNLLTRTSPFIAAMTEKGKAILYRSGTSIVSFTGIPVATIAFCNRSKHNLAGYRYDYWFRLDETIWHGYSCGKETNPITCRATKARKLPNER